MLQVVRRAVLDEIELLPVRRERVVRERAFERDPLGGDEVARAHDPQVGVRADPRALEHEEAAVAGNPFARSAVDEHRDAERAADALRLPQRAVGRRDLRDHGVPARSKGEEAGRAVGSHDAEPTLLGHRRRIAGERRRRDGERSEHHEAETEPADHDRSSFDADSSSTPGAPRRFRGPREPLIPGCGQPDRIAGRDAAEAPGQRLPGCHG